MNTVLAGVAMISLSGLFMYSNSVNEKLVETELKVKLLETTKLNMRRAEKDFLLYKDASYVTEFNNGMLKFHIAAAIEEQSLVANEVNRNVNNIRDIAQESSLMASENQKSSQNLSEQANILNKSVEKYKV